MVLTLDRRRHELDPPTRLGRQLRAQPRAVRQSRRRVLRRLQLHLRLGFERPDGVAERSGHGARYGSALHGRQRHRRLRRPPVSDLRRRRLGRRYLPVLRAGSTRTSTASSGRRRADDHDRRGPASAGPWSLRGRLRATRVDLQDRAASARADCADGERRAAAEVESKAGRERPVAFGYERNDPSCAPCCRRQEHRLARGKAPSGHDDRIDRAELQGGAPWLGPPRGDCQQKRKDNGGCDAQISLPP